MMIYQIHIKCIIGMIGNISTKISFRVYRTNTFIELYQVIDT